MALYAFALSGLFLVAAPWTQLWDHAAHTLVPRSVRGWVLAGWARGLVTGFGLLDLGVALQLAREIWAPRAPGS